jgi:hypothetical protein
MELFNNLIGWLLTVEEQSSAVAPGPLRHMGAALGLGGGLVQPLGTAPGREVILLFPGGAVRRGPGSRPPLMPSA